MMDNLKSLNREIGWRMRRIKVGRVFYKVLIVDKVKKGFQGWTDYSKKTIYVKNNSRKEDTLYHELAHVFLAESGIESGMSQKEIQKIKSNEVFVECLGRKLRRLKDAELF